MATIYVTEDTIASIIIIDKSLEEYPESYRGVDSTTLIVSFESYKKFIRKYLSVDNFLSNNTVLLKLLLASEEDDLLCRAFYRDMSLAIMKELWYVPQGGKPTQILHTVTDADKYERSYVNALGSMLKTTTKKLIKEMENHEYRFPKEKLEEFSDEVNYATVLYSMSLPDTNSGVTFTRWSMGEEDIYANERYGD